MMTKSRPSTALRLLLGCTALPSALSGYCNWGPDGTGDSSTCQLQPDGSHVQGGPWCNEKESNCESGCGGRWCVNEAEPTPSPTGDTYCNWGPDGTAASSTCEVQPDGSHVQGGDWCNANKQNCESGCQGNWCTNGPVAEVKTATTTRYWDCSGGSCACAYVPAGLPDSEPAHCHSNAMFAAPADNPFGARFYGAAAVSESLGGGEWMSEACGQCFKVMGTSNVAGYEGVTTTLVLKATNFCPDENPKCAVGRHFDIAAPGFDVVAVSFANTCLERQPEEAAGWGACGSWLIGEANGNPDENCDCSLFNDPTLRAGCENFFSLKWDNPTVIYEEVDCPPELADLHCGFPYATEENMPATCASNHFDGPTTDCCATE